MRKIASPQDLTVELRQLIAYVSGPRPSRERIAADLRSLADRVADGSRVAKSPMEKRIVNWARKTRTYALRELRDGTLAVVNFRHPSEPEYTGKTWEEVAAKLEEAGFDL